MCIYVHVSVKTSRTPSIWFSGTPVVGTNYLYSIGVWAQLRRGYTIFLKSVWGAPRCTPDEKGGGL